MTALAVSSWAFERTSQCGTGDHHPHRVYCPDPGECCLTEEGPLLCCLDSETWPCSAKQDHVAARTSRPAHPDPKETEPYDPEADFAATGTVVCGDCGRRGPAEDVGAVA